MRTDRTAWGIAAIAGMLLACAQVAGAWPQAQARAGAEARKGILAELGGEIDNTALSAYVTRVGRVIASVTDFAGEPWVFTVVDSPRINAFATPGGYVYITRGMVALANSEAELAAVLAHEIAHLTANHIGEREERNSNAGIGVLVGTALGAIIGGKEGLRDGIKLSTRLAQGYVAQFSQKQEFHADELGIRYLSAAGYDPMAQSRILAGLGASKELEGRIAGKAYNPNRVDFFASHPATADRVRRAQAIAERYPTGDRGEIRFMTAIDGMIYGDSAAQGFIRGRDFIHPLARFAFRVPGTFVLTNSTRAVQAEGPRGARFILEGGGPDRGDLGRHISGRWLEAIRGKYDTGALSQIERYSLNGAAAATAYLPVTIRGEPWVVQLTAVRSTDRVHRLTGLARVEDWESRFHLGDAARSYRVLNDRQAARATPFRISTTTLTPGDGLAEIAARMADVPLPDEVFLTLNGLASSADMIAGDRVKLVVP